MFLSLWSSHSAQTDSRFRATKLVVPVEKCLRWTGDKAKSRRHPITSDLPPPTHTHTHDKTGQKETGNGDYDVTDGAPHFAHGDYWTPPFGAAHASLSIT